MSDNEQSTMRSILRDDERVPNCAFDTFVFTPDVIYDGIRYGHFRYSDPDKKDKIRLTIKGRRFFKDMTHYDPKEDMIP